MTDVLAVCPFHGSFVAPNIFDIQGLGTSTITMKDNYTNCPRCGTMSPLMEGVFEFSGDSIVKILSAPNWTLARIKQARQALSWAQVSFPGDPDEALRRIEAASPEAAAVVQAARASGWTTDRILTLISVLIAALAFLQDYRANEQGDVTPAQIQQIADQVVEELGDRGLSTTPPEPASAVPPPPSTPAPSPQAPPAPPPPEAPR